MLESKKTKLMIDKGEKHLMSDIYRRMAYRNAARASFAENNEKSENTKQNQPTQTTNSGSVVGSNAQSVQTQPLKVYYAHGYVIRCDNLITNKEYWNGDSYFSEVFFSFAQAKEYLLQKFNNLVAVVYQNDPLFTADALSGNGFHKCDEQWQREYVSEYVDYLLVITEISFDYDEKAPIDFSSPKKVERYFRYNGQERTRYYVYGSKEYEFRASDYQSRAGTKFARGQIVKYTDWEFPTEYEGALVVFNTPQKPQDKATPWENCYELLLIEDYYNIKRTGRVRKVKIHEADLELYSLAELEDERTKVFHAPTLALQMVVMDVVGLDDKTTNSILNGDVLFNCSPSWQSIAELR